MHHCEIVVERLKPSGDFVQPRCRVRGASAHDSRARNRSARARRVDRAARLGGDQALQGTSGSPASRAVSALARARRALSAASGVSAAASRKNSALAATPPRRRLPATTAAVLRRRSRRAQTRRGHDASRAAPINTRVGGVGEHTMGGAPLIGGCRPVDLRTQLWMAKPHADTISSRPAACAERNAPAGVPSRSAAHEGGAALRWGRPQPPLTTGGSCRVARQVGGRGPHPPSPRPPRRLASRSPPPAVGAYRRDASRIASSVAVGLGEDSFPDVLVQRSAPRRRQQRPGIAVGQAAHVQLRHAGELRIDASGHDKGDRLRRPPGNKAEDLGRPGSGQCTSSTKQRSGCFLAAVDQRLSTARPRTK